MTLSLHVENNNSNCNCKSNCKFKLINNDHPMYSNFLKNNKHRHIKCTSPLSRTAFHSTELESASKITIKKKAKKFTYTVTGSELIRKFH